MLGFIKHQSTGNIWKIYICIVTFKSSIGKFMRESIQKLSYVFCFYSKKLLGLGTAIRNDEGHAEILQLAPYFQKSVATSPPLQKFQGSDT